MQIAGEEGRLNGVKQTKKEEIEFAENAFYTSNEEGMGVSPNAFISQNRMPKPARRTKSPAIEASVMPINEQIILQNQSNDGLQGISGRVSGGPLSDANNPIRSKSSKSKTGSK
jgi:hypothetical protein